MKKIIFASCFILCIACQNDISRPAPVEQAKYGFGYNLLQQPGFPRLVGDSLYIKVAFSGCSRNPSLTFKWEITNRTKAEVWFYMDESYQGFCDAYHEEIKTAVLPARVLSCREIVITGPFLDSVILKP